MVASLQELEEELKEIRDEMYRLNRYINLFRILDRENRVTSQVVKAYSGEGWQDVSNDEVILRQADLSLSWIIYATNFDRDFSKLLSHKEVDTLEDAVIIAEKAAKGVSSNLLYKLSYTNNVLKSYKGLLQ